MPNTRLESLRERKDRKKLAMLNQLALTLRQQGLSEFRIWQSLTQEFGLSVTLPTVFNICKRIKADGVVGHNFIDSVERCRRVTSLGPGESTCNRSPLGQAKAP
jgi:hypothetical protein